jgi:copper chaperone
MITRFSVDGMTCQHCVRAVFTALTAVDGIGTAEVAIGTIAIEHDGRITVEQVRDAVAVAGYKVRLVETERRRLRVILSEDLR